MGLSSAIVGSLSFLASLPILTDWQFYALAIPVVLLLGLSKSGFGAGFGSLAVPALALMIPVPQAAAILMPVLLVQDMVGVRRLWPHVEWALFKRLMVAGLVGIACGFALFKLLPLKAVEALVGLFALAFAMQRMFFPPHADAAPPPAGRGRVLSAVSGFTSFVAHAGGPPINAYLVPLKLMPVVFTATLSVFFAVINLSKWAPYAALGLIDWRNMATGLALLPFAPIGVLLGVRVAHRIDPVLFYKVINWGMVLTGLKLLWDAKGLIGL